VAPQAITDGMVDVGGVSLHIHCVGEGTPVVVLEAGLGNDATTWRETQPEIARFTRACAYNRAGTGYSGPAAKPHTSRQIGRELHALLSGAHIAGPYVLVGHSFGGLNVRMFASEHPNDVAGMVLVDASSEDQDTRIFGLLPEDQRKSMRATFGVASEGIDFDAFVGSMAEVRASNRALGDKPLVVLTRGRAEARADFPAELRPKAESAWQGMQAELPRLSTNSVHVVVANSGHFVHHDAPRMFVAAVRTVVDAARAHAAVDRTVIDGLAAKAASFTVERALARLFTEGASADWFAPAFVREVGAGQLDAVPKELSAGLGAFKRVAREGERYVVVFEKGTIPADARLDEDGRFVMLLFDRPARAPEPVGSAAPAGSAPPPPKRSR